MTPNDYIQAARVPERLKPQAFGRWEIFRAWAHDSQTVVGSFLFQEQVGFNSQTQLLAHTMATLHRKRGEVVMEDGISELRKHLPIWLCAKGHVLVTGLGLGCVVRGLLASPDVEQITVVEIDADILRVVGHEFRANPHVRLVHGDAFKVQLPEKFDCAWHDLWTDGDTHLQVLHAKLLKRFRPKVRGVQGAWELPRYIKRQMPEWVLR